MTVKQTVEIKNRLGMHARPAMKLFELVQSFDAEVLLRNDSGTEAEASSVIGLLMFDSAKGRMIEVEVTGPDEIQALAAVDAAGWSRFVTGRAISNAPSLSNFPHFSLCLAIP